MRLLKHLIARQWGVLLVAAVSILLVTWQLPRAAVVLVALAAVIVLILNWALELRRSRRDSTIEMARKLEVVVDDFLGRFVPSGSAYSIFYLIAELSAANTEKKAWCQGCSHSRRLLERLIRDTREELARFAQGRAADRDELHKVFDKFLEIVASYFRLASEFSQTAQTGNLPAHIEGAYNGFVAEYNDFTRGLRDLVTEAKSPVRLGANAKDIGFLKEIHLTRYG